MVAIISILLLPMTTVQALVYKKVMHIIVIAPPNLEVEEA